jgi:hypothetical protein
MSAILPGGWRIGPSISGDDTKIYIGSPGGEGGDFCKEEFEAVLAVGFAVGEMAPAIKRFFWENF